MKKILVVALAFIFTLGLFGCAKQEYELPWDHFCYSANDGSVIELASEEKNHIIDLLNNGDWYGEIAKCTQDVLFITKQQSIGYCISQGIFNDFTQSKSLRLSNADRKIVNEYLVKPATKLIEIEEYATLTRYGTTSIEVVYDYIKGEFTTYEFVIDDPEEIDNIMAEVFNIELKPYPEYMNIEFYQRWITVRQDDREYRIHLGYAFDDCYGYNYLCQSQAVHEIIEKYIEKNLLLPSGNVACADVSSLPEGSNC